MPSHLIIIALILFTWRPDETIREYGAGDNLWELRTLNSMPFTAPATLQFTKRYQISGRGPCNTFTAKMDIPFPWFGVGPIAATKRACSDLKAEAAFFDALRNATLSRATADQLILSDETTDLMVFERAD